MKRAPRAQIFDAAGARVTEPGVFDRDAADAAWIKAVEAAGVAKAERTDKTAAKTVETHGARRHPQAPPERTRPVTAPPRGAETEIRQTVAEAKRATTRSFRDAGKLVEKAAEIYHNGALRLLTRDFDYAKTQHLDFGERRTVECSSGLQPRKTTTPYGKSLSRRSVLAKPMRCRAI
jgi:hypothetical protein